MYTYPAVSAALLSQGCVPSGFICKCVYCAFAASVFVPSVQVLVVFAPSLHLVVEFSPNLSNVTDF